MDVLQIPDHFDHLSILLFTLVWDYWDAILQMKCKWEHIVIYNEGIFKVKSFKDPEILYKNILILQINSILSKVSMLYQSALRIQVIYNRIGIPILASREYGYFIVLVGLS